MQTLKVTILDEHSPEHEPSQVTLRHGSFCLHISNWPTMFMEHDSDQHLWWTSLCTRCFSGLRKPGYLSLTKYRVCPSVSDYTFPGNTLLRLLDLISWKNKNAVLSDEAVQCSLHAHLLYLHFAMWAPFAKHWMLLHAKQFMGTNFFTLFIM